ncbi:MAG: tRNA (adenosine(37)-N6)-dimethylallyltransferase MiaA [Alphaproteobacteria bacterium]|nr:tRNA (adenosine(37)-N6)-dimethylallyltransferase MiaA [Alphaproteobacteria bacterium]
MSVDAVCVAGLTASGKTEFARALGRRHGRATVINADAMQVYRGLRRVTDQPDDDGDPPHRLYGHVSVDTRYSVSRWLEDARTEIGRCRGEGRLPIFCGGTGLYFRSLVRGLDRVPAIDASVRAGLEARMDEIGVREFYRELEAMDVGEARRVGEFNRHRLLRAREVLEFTGHPLTYWWGSGGGGLLTGEVFWVIFLPTLAEVGDVIAARARGLVGGEALEEVRRLGDCGDVAPSVWKVIGVREIRGFLDGELDSEEAVRRVVSRTRGYARRQGTWFRNNSGATGRVIVVEGRVDGVDIDAVAAKLNN